MSVIATIFPAIRVKKPQNCFASLSTRECHGGSMLLHPVVHLHVFNSNGALYLQQRPDWKDIQPGRWDTAVGGHVDFGETIEEAFRLFARRRITRFSEKP